MIEQMYGFFPGGDYDPRKFVPDREVNTLDEIVAWERLCAAWDAGGASITPRSGRIVAEDNGNVSIRCGSSLGMGTYEIDMPDDGPDGDGEPMHYWPVAGNPAVACDVWIEPGVNHTSIAARVTCETCLSVLARAAVA